MRPRFMYNNQPAKRLITMLSTLSMVLLLNACGSDSDKHKKLDTLTANARLTGTYIISGQQITPTNHTFIQKDDDIKKPNDSRPVVYIDIDDVIVNLDASTSRSHVDILSYTWSQTAGTPVVLSDTTAVAPSFTAPSSETTLIFELEVVDTIGQVDIDTLYIAIAEPEALTSNSSGSIEVCAPVDGDDC